MEEYVEIGNNTCVDRAVMGSTFLRKNVKVDNLVHIAHGCDIGENSLVIANAMVAGSVQMGKNCWIAPSSSILNKVKIAHDATIGMGAVILKDVQKGEVVVGNPGKVIKVKSV
jgi:UDP-3-O-[3-hydroxymyristoyl] glucosamine N-acyltransferase